MNQRGRFYSNEEPPPENLRQLEEDVDSDTEVELNENEINIKGEANIVEEVMNGIIPENSINNTTQRYDESSDESEDDYCVNKNSDEKATILAMYKSRDGAVWSKSSSISLSGRREALKTLFVYRVVP